ncbi:venom protease-like [Tribolium madens]|uniref:venom protease-like n=1 Tax=Tribolium madens TaxID=41895 RepID=UPI001CF75079|nr:venom protease-like [Tribolium madens]
MIFKSLLFLFCFKFYVSGQAIGTECTTPDQKPGSCTNIDDCPFLLNLLMNHNTNNTVRTYLRTAVCEYSGRNPVVCCPKQVTSASKLPKSPACGFSNNTIPRVVNGVPAKLGEFPWIVALGYRNSKNPEMPKWLCGGSLITKKHVLTAAHCVHNRRDLYIARLGDLDLYSDDDGATPSTIPLAKAKIHPDYNPTRFTNDIAILTLKETVNNPTVWPVCLPTIDPYRSMSYLNFSPTLAGWGSISFNGPSSSTLQQIFVPVLSQQQCERAFSRVATIDNKIICAGSLNGDKDACGGDSGGPLMNEINEGTNYRIYQIGIVSYGFRCATPGYPGVYTRVTAFVDWIEQNLD